MIELKDGTILRNLEEQVLENKKQIALHWNVDRVLADFGINMRGRLNSKADLDQIATDDLEYGDAYLVGTEAPYSVWIWTRADVNAGQLTDYWLDIGNIAIQGPKGEQGPQGAPGKDGKSTIWYSGSSSPLPSDTYNAGDMFLLTNTANASSSNGNIYRYNGNTWQLQGNIRGPQGIQGLQGPKGEPGERGPQGAPGERGDVGGFINIYGILSDANQLPLPEDIKNLTVAYLVGTEAPYILYVQVGENSEEAIWTNVGEFNAATLVTVGGEGQNIWDADSKLDKSTATTNKDQVYIKWAGGMQGMMDLTYHAEPFVIPRRDQYGSFILPEGIPEQDNRAISKGSADTLYVPKSTVVTEKDQVYVKWGGGMQGLVDLSSHAEPLAIARRDQNGSIILPEEVPTSGNRAISKTAADASYVPVTTTAGNRVYVSQNGTNSTVQYATGAQANTFALRGNGGALAVGTPTVATHAANKQYVDDNFTSKQYVDDNFLAKIPAFTSGRYRFNTYGPNDAVSTVEIANYGNAPTGYAMMRANGTGNVTVADPTAGTDAANKQYVDNSIKKAVVSGLKKYTYTFILFNAYSSSSEDRSWHYIVFNVESDIETIPTSTTAIVQMLITEGYNGSSTTGGKNKILISQSSVSGSDPTDAVVLIWGNPTNNNLYFTSKLDTGVRLVIPSTTSFKAYRTPNNNYLNV